MDENRANRASRASQHSGNWRLSTIMRPLSTNYTTASSGRMSVEEGWTSDWSTGVPSIQPTSFDRLGSISPTSGVTSGTYAYLDDSHEMRRASQWRTSSVYSNVVNSPWSNSQDEEAGEEYEMEKQGDRRHYSLSPAAADRHDEEGTMGLVQRTPSYRHVRRSGHHKSWATPQTAIGLGRAASQKSEHPPMPRTASRRELRRESKVLSALPDLPDNLYSGAGTPARSSATDSVMAEKRKSARPASTPIPVLPPQGPPGAPEKDPNLVLWDGPRDPGNPMNWPQSKKWASTFALGFVTFCVTFASSVFSPGTLQAAEEFGVSAEVMVLGTALFVLGFAFGPIIWGPMSELYGRKWPMFLGFVIFAIFHIPVAVAQNLETLLVCRFLAGVAGCAPLTIVGGALADFWPPVERGVAVSIFSGATFLGPTGGPIVGGYLTETAGLGWRWTAWVTIMAACFFGTIGWFVYDESFGPVLLQQRAKKLRFATKNWAIHAPADEIEINMNAILNRYLTKPVMMLIWEPILLLVTIYISFIYGILYLFFETYPISFIMQRHWSLGVGGLPFLAVMTGVLLGGVVNWAFIRTRYVRIMKQQGRVPPEERLVPMMVGSVALPVGLFIYAWTSSPEMTPIPQIVAGVPVGLGIVLIFLQGINYIIDIYMMFSNSAIAGNTIIRSAFGAAFPMFATFMYRSLGVKWATATLGFVAVGLIPVPILFFIYGARIRKLSKYTPKFPPGMVPGGPPGPPMTGPPGGGPPGR